MVAGELMVRVIGGLTVSRSGQVVPARYVGSRKARILLALLAVHRGPVSVERIVAALWEEAPPQRPTANVATLVSRLRATLGTHGIISGPTGYRFGEQVRVDLSAAGDLTSDAESRLDAGQPALALMAARCAINLLDQGMVLAEQPDARWADPARARHGDLLRRARRAAAEAALRIGDVRAARAAAEAAVIADVFDEGAVRLLMRAYHAAGEPARALIVYKRLRATLAAELGVDPAPTTRALHQDILQDTSTEAVS